MWAAAAEYLRGRLVERGARKALALRSGVPDATLSRWLAGQQTPDVDSAARIAFALGLTLGELMGESPRPAPDDWEEDVAVARDAIDVARRRLEALLARRSDGPLRT